MNNQPRRLGRGLEALLGRPLDASAGEMELDGSIATLASAGPREVNVHEIDSNPYQPRREFDEQATSELAESIKEHGVLQPLIVRRHADRYQLIAGERRLRAAMLAGVAYVPIQVRDADDRQMAELAIVENLQRKDLSALEKAASFQDYLERYGSTQEELAGRLKIDRSTLSNLIRLLELPFGVQEALRAGTISAGHARAILPLGDEREQLALCRRIEEEALSVRATEQIVQEAIRQADADPLDGSSSDHAEATPVKRPVRASSGHVVALEKELRALLGTKSDIRQAASGRGRIVIHFSNHGEFERIWQQLQATTAAAPSQSG